MEQRPPRRSQVHALSRPTARGVARAMARARTKSPASRSSKTTEVPRTLARGHARTPSACFPSRPPLGGATRFSCTALLRPYSQPWRSSIQAMCTTGLGGGGARRSDSGVEEALCVDPHPSGSHEILLRHIFKRRSLAKAACRRSRKRGRPRWARSASAPGSDSEGLSSVCPQPRRESWGRCLAQLWSGTRRRSSGGRPSGRKSRATV